MWPGALMINDLDVGRPGLNDADFTFAGAAVAEWLFSTALCFVVLSVACTAKAYPAGNHFFGLAIGSTVMAGAASVGNISGGW